MTDPLDTKARELLAAAYRHFGHDPVAVDVERGSTVGWDAVALHAISSALRAAPDGYNMPCGKCPSGVYDDAALAAFDGAIPKCGRHDRLCVGAVHAMQASRQSEGYVLVPVEPTAEMRRRGTAHVANPYSLADDVWAAMIAARPGEGA